MKSLKDMINENVNESIPEGSVKNLVRSLVGLLSTDSDRNKYKKMAEIFYDSLKEASNEDSKKGYDVDVKQFLKELLALVD